MLRIKENFELEGPGLHSGKNCRVTIEPLKSDYILIRSGENLKNQLPINQFKTSGTGRGSDYIFPDGERIRTCEHVLAGFSGLGIWNNLRITVEGGEMPALDGCAGKICKEILKHSEEIEIEFENKDNKNKIEYLSVSEPLIVYDEINNIKNEKRFAAFFPSDVKNNNKELYITCAVEYKVAGFQILDFKYSQENFYSEISEARTFALLSEIEYLRANGMALGGSLDNAILIDDVNNKIQASGGLRWENEFVRHKILDLIGDLASLGRPLSGHLIILRGGHSLHLKLADLIKLKIK